MVHIMTYVDIIACLIIGVILMGVFIAWERHLENSVTGPDKPKSFWTPPPLMKPSIWARARGRMAVILVIAFLNWAGFIAWTLWVQVCPSSLCDNARMLMCPTFSCSTKITLASLPCTRWSDLFPCLSWDVSATFLSRWWLQNFL